MKNLKYILVLFGLLFLASCEDVVEVPLDEADPILVVDAWLNNLDSLHTIKLSLSQPYFDSSLVQTVTGAEVVVTSSAGEVFNFSEGPNSGTYITPSVTNIGTIEDEFTLSIDYNGITYTSTSKMNRVPAIDSIKQEFVDDDPFLDDGVYCNFFAKDFAGEGDTYWIKTFKDGRFLNQPAEINIAYDSGFDGGVIVDSEQVFIQPIQDLNNEIGDNFTTQPWLAGEVIRVEIHSLNSSSFAFLELMRDQLLNSFNGIFAEPLSNTPSNIVSSDGSPVLGCFNVAAVSSFSAVIE